MRLELSRTRCLGEALRDALLTYKSNDAIFEADRHREVACLSYSELRREAERLSAVLQADGFEAGDRCAILMSNQLKWVVGAMGGLFAGAVLVPLDYKLTAAEQLALVAHARPRVLLVEYPVWRDFADEDRSALESVRVLVSEAPEHEDLGGAERWERTEPGVFTFVMRERADLASIVYSSGTGGTPKGCMLTHDNYLAQAQILGRMFPMQEGDRYLSLLPTNHAIDFMCSVVVPYLFGAAVVHQRTLRAEFLAPTMKRYGVTHTAMVPRILRALEEKIREQLDELPDWKRQLVDGLIGINDLATMREPSHRLSSLLLKPIHDRFGGRLRTIFAGGAFVEPELAQFFYRLGFPVAIGYGLTEACTVLTVNDLSPFRPDSVGRPVEGVELSVRDVNADGVGEVYARGPTIMRGYLDAPELTDEALVDGWLRTGDLGVIDASGHLRLLGRAKNMIVTEGGKNVYPEDVEACFERVSCEELCVFAASYLWPGRSLSDAEQLVLVVRPKKGQNEGELLEALAERNRELVEHKRVGSFLVWHEDFPVTASMKVKRAVLAEAIRGQEPALREAV